MGIKNSVIVLASNSIPGLDGENREYNQQDKHGRTLASDHIISSMDDVKRVIVEGIQTRRSRP